MTTARCSLEHAQDIHQIVATRVRGPQPALEMYLHANLFPDRIRPWYPFLCDDPDTIAFDLIELDGGRVRRDLPPKADPKDSIPEKM